MRFFLFITLAISLYSAKLSDVLTIDEIAKLQANNYTDKEMIQYAKTKMLLYGEISKEHEANRDPKDTKLKNYCVNVNLKTDSLNKNLDVCVMVGSTKQDYIVKDHLINILSSKTQEEVSSKMGKEKIKKQIQDTLHTAAAIYFTEFTVRESPLP